MLLAFDTASPYATVALHDGEGVVGQARAARPLQHAEQLEALIDGLLRDAGLLRFEVTALAVGTGPGPSEALQAGLDTARTLAANLDIPAYGVCSLDVIALEAAERLAYTSGFLVATDAGSGEVYLAAYDEQGTRVSGPVLARTVSLVTDLPAAGEGAVLHPEAFGRPVDPSLPSAGWLARAVADERAELTDPEPLHVGAADG